MKNGVFRKVISAVCVVLILFNASFTAVAANETITVTLNGTAIEFEQPLIVQDGRTLVPMRAIFEAMGATVEWEETFKTVTGTKGDIVVKMQIGNNVLTKNGQQITLDVSPQLVNGRILVPVRVVAESFDADVDWNGETQTVTISSNLTEKSDIVEPTGTETPNPIPIQQQSPTSYNVNADGVEFLYTWDNTSKLNTSIPDGATHITVDVYDVLYLSLFSNNDWEAITVPFREVFESLGFTGQVSNGDYIFSNDGEHFIILGKEKSQKVMNESAMVYILHYIEPSNTLIPSTTPTEIGTVEEGTDSQSSSKPSNGSFEYYLPFIKYELQMLKLKLKNPASLKVVSIRYGDISQPLPEKEFGADAYYGIIIIEYSATNGFGTSGYDTDIGLINLSTQKQITDLEAYARKVYDPYDVPSSEVSKYTFLLQLAEFTKSFPNSYTLLTQEQIKQVHTETNGLFMY